MSGIMETIEVVNVYNPLLDDFAYTWFDDNNSGHVIVLPALQITQLPKIQADFMVKHLIDTLDIKRGGTEREDLRREKIMKEIIK